MVQKEYDKIKREIHIQDLLLLDILIQNFNNVNNYTVFILERSPDSSNVETRTGDIFFIMNLELRKHLFLSMYFVCKIRSLYFQK